MKTRIEPLKQFICDTCGDLIENIDDGIVIWHEEISEIPYKFAIVHKTGKSPRPDGCDNQEKLWRSLESFIDGHSMIKLSDLIGNNSKNFVENSDIYDNYIYFLKRLYIPYFEEGRVYRDREEVSEFEDFDFFSSETLKQIIELCTSEVRDD